MGTWALRELKYLGTRELKALKYLATWAFEAIYLADSLCNNSKGMAFAVCLCLSANCFSIKIDLLDYIILATQRWIIKTGAFALLLKVQSCKLYNNKYMTASTRIANTGIFAFIAVAVVKLLSRKVLCINRKNNRNG